MTDLRLEREFRIPAERLFEWISQSGKLLEWWGPEGMHVPDGTLDFNKTGPWYSVMSDGADMRVKVSGHVTHVDPPHSVGFTWGWHDENDARGVESHVTFTVVPTDSGARLIIDHRELPDSDRAANHERGWLSSLRKLAEKAI